MAATVTRLRSKADRLRKDQAQSLVQYLLQFPELEKVPERALGRVLAALDQITVVDEGWSFVMLSPAQNAAVVRWIHQHSKRPLQASLLWAECFTALRSDTGEIMLTRLELADRIGTHENHVSCIMSEFIGIGAISSRREKVPGLRGPGMVRYFMNPNVATHLATSQARSKAQAAAPTLRLVTSTPAASAQIDIEDVIKGGVA